MKPTRLPLLLLAALSLTPLWAADRTVIAVMAFEGKNGVAADIAVGVSDLIGTALVGLKRFTVVERETTAKKILAEVALQNSGVCTDERCAVKIGELLRAQKLLVGTVTRFGGRLLVTVKLVDVAKGTSDLAESVQAADESDLIPKATLLAHKISQATPVVGRVTGIRADGLIEVNLGTDDGLRAGTTVRLVSLGQMRQDQATGDPLGREVLELGTARIDRFVPGGQLSLLRFTEKLGEVKLNDQAYVEGSTGTTTPVDGALRVEVTPSGGLGDVDVASPKGRALAKLKAKLAAARDTATGGDGDGALMTCDLLIEEIAGHTFKADTAFAAFGREVEAAKGEIREQKKQALLEKISLTARTARQFFTAEDYAQAHSQFTKALALIRASEYASDPAFTAKAEEISRNIAEIEKVFISEVQKRVEDIVRRKGDVALAAEKYDEATTAYREALAELEMSSYKNAGALVDLATLLRARIAKAEQAAWENFKVDFDSLVADHAAASKRGDSGGMAKSLAAIKALLVKYPAYGERGDVKEVMGRLRQGGRAGQKIPFTVKGVTFNMCYIPAGTFIMGSSEAERLQCEKFGLPKNWIEDERPHQVTLSDPYLMGETEVTQELYLAVMGANPSCFENLKNPVEQVTWDDAVLFCRKISEMSGRQFSLPSEAQWEYACRAGTTTAFYVGDDLGESQASFNAKFPFGEGKSGRRTDDPNYTPRIAKVGSFEPNAWGLFDMIGNVTEWCDDVYGEYPQDDRVNPKGNSQGPLRVWRGGGAFMKASECRSARRNKFHHGVGWGGFRLMCLVVK